MRRLLEPRTFLVRRNRPLIERTDGHENRKMISIQDPTRLQPWLHGLFSRRDNRNPKHDNEISINING